jgi:hypothetical protein
MQWLDIDADFFAVNPNDVIWSEVFALPDHSIEPETT